MLKVFFSFALNDWVVLQAQRDGPAAKTMFTMGGGGATTGAISGTMGFMCEKYARNNLAARTVGERVAVYDSIAAIAHRLYTYLGMVCRYMRTGKFGDRSEVFSFGVTMLEILTGRRNQDVDGGLVE